VLDFPRAWLVGLGSALAGLAAPACRSTDGGADGAPQGHCADRGTVYVEGGAARGDPGVRLRATHGGCEPCPKDLKKGAPVGSRCAAPSVCGEVCCECPGSRRSFTVAACVDGTCASRDAACRAGLSRFSSRLCPD
jgi:hypothetical protein